MPKQRLKTLQPRLSTLKPVVSTGREGLSRDQYRRTEQPWRKWYASREWKALRLRILIRDKWKCRMCGKVSFKSGAMVCDHIEPHRGDEALFLDENNLQTLCADPCHNKHKQNAERFL